MRNLNKWLIPAVVVAALGVVSAVPAGNARADTTASLPITSFYQVVADTAHGHVFISQGSSSLNEIVVTNLAGQDVTTITGQEGVMGIALSPDGSTCTRRWDPATPYRDHTDACSKTVFNPLGREHAGRPAARAARSWSATWNDRWSATISTCR